MSRGARTALIIGIVAFFLVIVLVVGGFIALSLGRLAGATDGYREYRIDGDGRQKIAVINVAGEIHGGQSSPSLFGGGGAGADDITAQLRRAGRDDQVAGVVLRIDSPGGAVVASDEIARAVERLSESKPVVASMGDVAASGGYYIASQTQRIVANRGTITGSIGVIAVLFNLEGTAEKLGAKPIVLKSGEAKDAGSPFREFSDEDRKIYQKLIDESYDQFVDVVAEGREMSDGAVRKIADGRPYSGIDAERIGLVDELGDLHDAYDAALELADVTRDDARLVEYRRQSGFGGLLGLRFGGAVEDVRRELGFEPGLKYLFTP